MIVYIAGCTHGGTTLLYRLLNAHPEVISLGSVNNLDGKVRTRNKKCQCGQPIPSCDFWTSVDSTVQKYDELRRLSDLNVSARNIDVFRRDNDLFFQAVSTCSGYDVMVDSSRKPARLKQLISAFGSDKLKVVAIYKKPPAQIFSWTKGQGKRKDSFFKALTDYFSTWFSIITITRDCGDVSTVSYEEFCDDPRAGLRELFDFLEVDNSGHVVDNILNTDLKELRCHALGGQPLSFSPNEIRKDERWKNAFGAPKQLLSWSLCCLPYVVLRKRTMDKRARS